VILAIAFGVASGWVVETVLGVEPGIELGMTLGAEVGTVGGPAVDAVLGA
jgi:hypothetical protein